MIIYLLKMIACSAAFYALYHFFFSKEKMLVFNRVYLLLGLVASFIIPLITFTVYVPASPAPVEVYPMNDTVLSMVTEPVVAKPDYLLWISVTIAVLITLVLLMRLVKNLLRLRSSIIKSEKIKFENAQLVLLEKETVPFSFMQNIFINKNEYEQGRVADAVIAHEMAHIQQKHSWDILFVELLQVFTWFNPMLYLYKSAIKTNHEFLADEAVVQQTADRLHYQQLLLQSVYVNNNIPLASSFYFTTKKRLIMLQKTFKRKRAVWAGMSALPLLGLLIYFLSSKVYAQIQNDDLESRNSIFSNRSTIGSDSMKITEVTIAADGKSTIHKNNFPRNVKKIKVFKNKNKESVITIDFRDGKTVTEDISTIQKRNAVEKRYGIKLIPDAVYGGPVNEYEVSYPLPRPSTDIKNQNKSEPLRPTLVVNNKTGEKSISKEEMKEYDDLMKEMAVKKNGRTYYKFIDGKTQKAADIYKRMSVEQRKQVVQFPPPPPLPEKETVVIGKPIISENTQSSLNQLPTDTSKEVVVIGRRKQSSSNNGSLHNVDSNTSNQVVVVGRRIGTQPIKNPVNIAETGKSKEVIVVGRAMKKSGDNNR